MKIRLVGAELFHADRWIDKMKLIDAFKILRAHLKALINFLLHHFSAFYQKQ